MKVVDVSDPANPRLVGSCRWERAFAQDVAVSGGRAYVADTDGIVAVDISNPRDPRYLGRVQLPGAFVEAVSYASGKIILASGGAGIFELDAGAFGGAVEPDLLPTPGYSLEAVFDRGLVYVADYDAGLTILDVQPMDKLAAGATYPATPPIPSDARRVVRSSPTPAFPAGTVHPERDVPTPTRMARSATQGQPDRSRGALVSCRVNSTADDGPGALRWCLENIAEAGVITFDVSVFPPERPAAITPVRPLPPLERSRVVVDASDAGVILDGSRTPAGTSGLVLRSEGQVIKGLQIVKFPNVGIDLQGARKATIGGDRARGRAPTGEGNLVSGNGEAGIRVCGADTQDNLIVGNLIGADVKGTAAWSNGRHGVLICAGATSNRIGGATPGTRNLVSGNASDGIVIEGLETRRNVIAGNLIGTDLSGTSAIPNRGNGVFLLAPENIVGGTSPEQRNVISGNQSHGVGFIGPRATSNQVLGNYIGCDLTGDRVLSNGDHGVALEMGSQNNLIKDNVIVSTGRNAVLINDWGSSYNAVVGNRLGTDASGTRLLTPRFTALQLGMGASFNRIGGPDPADRNVIAGGVHLGRHLGVGNLILGNYLGLDAAGRTGIGFGPAVTLGNGARRVLLGGATAAEGNVISSGVGGWGVQVGPYVDDAFIASNRIGTDAAGQAAVGNQGDGVVVSSGERNIIQGNVIAYSSGVGVRIRAGRSNVVRRNSIHSNRGPGIVLESGGNQLTAAPVLAAASGSILGLACPFCEIEIFSDEQDQGRTLEGVTRADSSGAFRWQGKAPAAGPRITATATDPSGNTSPFSVPRRNLPADAPLLNLSAASYLADALAPDSIVAAFGSGLANQTAAAESVSLPTELAGARVAVTDSGGAERPAPLYFISPAQVNFVVPAATAPGPATVRLTDAQGRTHAGEIMVATVAPGLFSISGPGQGLAAAALLRIHPDGSRTEEIVTGPIDLGAPEEQVYLILFGTGIRRRSSLANVTVRVAGESLPPLYAGPQGDYPGLDQINVLLPAQWRGRGHLDLTVVVDGKTSNPVQLRIR